MSDGLLKQCKVCVLSRQKEYVRKNYTEILRRAEQKRRRAGIKSVDETTNPYTREGRRCERFVAGVLKSLKYKNVVLGNGRGPDVRAVKGSRKLLRFEVKKATKNVKAESFTVGSVSPRQRGNEYIAIVHKSFVWIQLMSEHLLRCNAVGVRAVTHICRTLEEAEQHIVCAGVK